MSSSIRPCAMLPTLGKSVDELLVFAVFAPRSSIIAHWLGATYLMSLFEAF